MPKSVSAVDECHHISAYSFEQVLNQVRGKYILGLTATPVRRDGHHPIIIMQCGPVRFRTTDKEQAKKRSFEHIVIPKSTDFALPAASKGTIHEIYAALIANQGRNDLIFDDVVSALEEGRSPLLLTERVEHLEEFARRLKNFARNLIVFKGGMGKNQRAAFQENLAAIAPREERLILATGRYIGEGFDDARLDTLFLASKLESSSSATRARSAFKTVLGEQQDVFDFAAAAFRLDSTGS